ncbi:magnesium chelatase domain-containing protein [Bacillaceae bacterium S4-13-56]
MGCNPLLFAGLPNTSVKESKGACVNPLHRLGYLSTDHKVVVNISPVEQKKVGPFHDVATAFGLVKE